MKIKDFYELVEQKKSPDASLLANLQYRIKKYPFFQPDIFIYLKCLYLSNSDIFYTELGRLAALVKDRKALFYYIMNDLYSQFQQKVEKKLTKNRTDQLISAFFSTLNEPENDSVLNDILINSNNILSTDYFSYLNSKGEDINSTSINYIPLEDLLETEDDLLLSPEIISNSMDQLEENELPVLKHQDIIDQFIAKAASEDSLRIQLDPSAYDEVDETDPDDLSDIHLSASNEELENDFFFTQTLANIYIKQKKYQRAYEIIKHLSLNYPEKSVYFADQLSFLAKVIKNTKNLNNK